MSTHFMKRLKDARVFNRPF